MQPWIRHPRSFTALLNAAGPFQGDDATIPKRSGLAGDGRPSQGTALTPPGQFGASAIDVIDGGVEMPVKATFAGVPLVGRRSRWAH